MCMGQGKKQITGICMAQGKKQLTDTCIAQRKKWLNDMYMYDSGKEQVNWCMDGSVYVYLTI